MLSLFKKNKDQGVPGWASFFTPKEYNRFLKELKLYFEKMDVEIKIENGAIHFAEENEFGQTYAGIVNLAQNCKHHNTSYYKEMIRLHFESLRIANQSLKKMDGIKSDFTQISKFLAVRVHHASYIDHLEIQSTVGFHFGEDLFALLVYDFPEMIEGVIDTDFKSWDKSSEEVFIIAVQNVFSANQFPVAKQNVDGIDFYAIITDHLFSSNIYFDIENRSELIGIHGSVICFPHRHTTLIYPIDNLDIAKIIAHLAVMTYGMYVEGPGSISKKLYWYVHGELKEIEYSIGDGNAIIVTPSEQFLEMLNTLGGNEENKILN